MIVKNSIFVDNSTLLNLKQCTKDPPNIKHAGVNARVHVRSKLNESKLKNVLLMQKKRKKNNLHYNKFFTLLEIYYFQEQLEQYQTSSTVYQLNTMYADTFTFMPAEKDWIYDSSKHRYHN